MDSEFMHDWKRIKSKLDLKDREINALVQLIDQNREDQELVLQLLQKLYRRTGLNDIKKLEDELTLASPERRSFL